VIPCGRTLVAAMGPIVTAALALFILNSVASWAQRRREAAQRESCGRRADGDRKFAVYLAL